MKFLTRLGQLILEGVKIVNPVGIGHIIERLQKAFPNNPGIAVMVDTLEEIAQLVMLMEAIGQQLGLPGAEKLKGIAPLIGQVIMRSPLLKGRKIAAERQALFKQGCTKLVDGVVDILNSLNDKIESEDKT